MDYSLQRRNGIAIAKLTKVIQIIEHSMSIMVELAEKFDSFSLPFILN